MAILVIAEASDITERMTRPHRETLENTNFLENLKARDPLDISQNYTPQTPLLYRELYWQQAEEPELYWQQAK